MAVKPSYFPPSEEMVLIKILKLGRAAQGAIKEAVYALFHRDEAIADKVLQFNAEMVAVSRDVKTTLGEALRSPVMGYGVRWIVAVQNMSSDMEEIWNYAVGIAEIAKILAKSSLNLLGEGDEVGEIRDMANVVCKMVNKSVQAIADRDVKTARKVLKLRDAVEVYFYRLFDSVRDSMRRRPRMIGPFSYLLYVIRYLRGIGDHSANIASQVIYVVEGGLEAIDNRRQHILTPWDKLNL